MNMPNIAQKHDYYPYWKPVESGETEPDEWQLALMNLVKEALNQGIFYTVDLMKWMKENAIFVPVDWWDIQYSGHKVEGGKMGMEVYSARKAVEEKKNREENEKVLKDLEIGKLIGTMSVNYKRINKCIVESINNGFVVFTGVTGRYPCRFSTPARNIPHMIENAVNRGWRK